MAEGDVSVAVAIERLRAELGERLAKLEAGQEAMVRALGDHTAADASHFGSLNQQLTNIAARLNDVETTQAIAKASGTRAGRVTATRWATLVAALVLGMAEAARAMGWLG